VLAKFAADEPAALAVIKLTGVLKLRGAIEFNPRTVMDGELAMRDQLDDLGKSHRSAVAVIARSGARAHTPKW